MPHPTAPLPGQQPEIVPFWNRLPQVLLYPAHIGVLTVIVVLGVAQVLSIIPMGWIIALVAQVGMYRYAFECLRSTAEGFMQPPEVGLGSDRDLGWRFIGLMLIFAILIVLAAIRFGGGAGLVVAIVLVACSPAATMVLAIDQSLGQALNPLRWLAVITGIGWPYLTLFGVCVAIFLSERYAKAFVAPYLSLAGAVIAIGIISNYAITALFHLMGYALFQYHEQLGLETVAEPTGPLRTQAADPDQEKLDEAAALVRDGKLEDAVVVLGGALRRGGTPAVHAQYRKLLRAAGDNAGLLAHGRERLPMLIEQGEAQAAVELLRECQAIEPSFAPETAAHISRVADMAAHVGQVQAALQVLEGFDDRFPGSQYRAGNALLVADLLHDKLGRDEQARDVLLRARESLPSDPLRPEIDARLAVIERMIAATARKPRPDSGQA